MEVCYYQPVHSYRASSVRLSHLHCTWPWTICKPLNTFLDGQIPISSFFLKQANADLFLISNILVLPCAVWLQGMERQKQAMIGQAHLPLVCTKPISFSLPSPVHHPRRHVRTSSYATIDCFSTEVPFSILGSITFSTTAMFQEAAIHRFCQTELV